MNRIIFLMILGLFTSLYASTAQENTRIITGKVTEISGEALIGANVGVKGTTIGTITDIDGAYSIAVPNEKNILVFSYTGFATKEIRIKSNKTINVVLIEGVELGEIVVTGLGIKREKRALTPYEMNKILNNRSKVRITSKYAPYQIEYEIDKISKYTPPTNTEEYGQLVENKFTDPINEALSTFSIDVDRAAYSNMRRFIDNGSLPPTDAVRIEEMINYFKYDYQGPKGDHPVALHSNLVSCPWNKEHAILHVAMKGKEIPTEDLPQANLVFLIDVSGSMDRANKLPLVKSSFRLLLNTLKDDDRVAIVTYAGRSGVALESTPAKEKSKILAVIDKLGAGGSTAGAEGILSAYEIAKENFIKGGNNRVILATDGDFNVGVSSNDALEKLIEKKRKSGVYLSVLGYGMGNYKDQKMQTLAEKGNGNNAYIDNLQEARKVLVNEFAGTLFTIAKDVKFQLEFNPARVKAYRLIGYESRMLKKEDFNNDQKDAGEIGSGHVVTALYEIVPVGSKSNFAGNVDPLKYQKEKQRPKANHSSEMATIKFRYKKPDEDSSIKVDKEIKWKVQDISKASEDVQFALAVAEFGMIIKQSEFKADATLDQVIKIAENSRAEDADGYRAEFIRLVKTVKDMGATFVSEN